MTTTNHPSDLPTGLTEAQKDAVRGAAECFNCAKCHALRDAFPSADVAVTWKSGDPDEKRYELLRVARMEGAHVVADWCGVKLTGSMHHTSTSPACLWIGEGAWAIPMNEPDWTITVTAPKPVDPTGGDPVVRASLVYSVDNKKCIFFRAQDGWWSRACDSELGMWGTSGLAEVERLSAQTIAELMGDAS